MKFAYFVQPHLGGTYSVYLNLRAGLQSRGIEVQGVALAAPDSGIPPGNDLDRDFLLLPGGGRSEANDGRVLIDRLRAADFNGIFVNVLAERMQMNVARYLPRDMLRIMIVHSITPATYAAAACIRDNVHATVAVSERARRDLIARHGFSPRLTRTINNAVDVDAMSRAARIPPAGIRLRLLYLGRVDDSSKGVMWLPAILSQLPRSVTLTVAGDGPDLGALKQALTPFEKRAACLGPVPRADIPQLLADHDALILPSRFEGSPVTLMEAMSAGCVPVASRIAAVTDKVVEHGVSGLLFPVGDWRSAAEEVAMLAEQPETLKRLSANARRQAAAEFGLAQMADAYADLIMDVLHARPSIAEPLPLGQWRIPAGFRPGLRTLLPRPVKNWLRMASERL